MLSSADVIGTTDVPRADLPRRRGSAGRSCLLLGLPFLPLLSGSEALRIIGVIAFALACTGLLAGLTSGRRAPHWRSGAAVVWLMLIAGAIQTRAITTQTLVQVAQLVLIAMTLRIAPHLPLSRAAALWSVVWSALLAALAIIDLSAGRELMFENRNGYGVAAFCWVALQIQMLRRLRSRAPVLRASAWMIAPLTVAVLSESRSSLAAIAVAVGWVGLTAVIPNGRLRIAAATATLLIPLAMLGLAGTGGLGDVQEVFPLVGEKSPFSGRDIIWFDIVGELAENGFRGFGLGSLPGSILSDHYEGLSAHNGFLQVFYQLGAAGLGLFLLLCAQTIHAAASRDDGGISLGIFLGALVHEVFEVALTQNHFGAGLVLWIVVCINTQPPGRRLQATV